MGFFRRRKVANTGSVNMGSLSDRYHFTRTDDLMNISRHLMSGVRSIWITAERRIGKTTFLRDDIDPYFLREKKYVSFYCDLRSHHGSIIGHIARSFEEFKKRRERDRISVTQGVSAAAGMSSQFQVHRASTRTTGGTVESTAFQQAHEGSDLSTLIEGYAERENINILIQLDEVHILNADDQISAEVRRQLKAILSGRRVRLIATGSCREAVLNMIQRGSDLEGGLHYDLQKFTQQSGFLVNMLHYLTDWNKTVELTELQEVFARFEYVTGRFRGVLAEYTSSSEDKTFKQFSYERLAEVRTLCWSVQEYWDKFNTCTKWLLYHFVRGYRYRPREEVIRNIFIVEGADCSYDEAIAICLSSNVLVERIYTYCDRVYTYYEFSNFTLKDWIIDKVFIDAVSRGLSISPSPPSSPRGIAALATGNGGFTPTTPNLSPEGMRGQGATGSG